MARLPFMLWAATALWAQHEGMPMGGGAMAHHDGSGAFLMREASGTSESPASAAMHMIHMRAGSWMIMLHGAAFLGDVQQSGPRGRDKLLSMNWAMGAAEHKLAGGMFQFRTMLSLDPATVTGRSYPELFQTGETVYGRPLVDAQHPHDFFMEVAAQYVR